MNRSLLPLLLVSLLTACTGAGGTNEAQTDAVRAFVKVAPAAVGTVERTLELTATVQAGRSLDLVTDIPGKIRDLPVKVGDEVKAGALLARLDTDMARYQYDQAVAATQLAALGASTAEREFGRAQALYETRSMTDQQYEQARSGVQMAQLQVAQAEAMKLLADKQVRGGVLTAPFDGVVSAVCCELGAYFNPMTLNPMAGPRGLVSLVNIDTVKMDLQVSERDIGLVQADMPAHVLVDAVKNRLPPTGLAGRVEFAGLAADAASRTFPVRVVADNPDHVVKAGTHARVRIVLEARADALSVPVEAVRSEKGTSYVVTVESGKAHRKQVQVGLEGDETLEVVAGLTAGEQVVVDGNFGLPDGASVDVTE